MSYLLIESLDSSIQIIYFAQLQATVDPNYYSNCLFKTLKT